MSAREELARAEARVGTVLNGKYRLDRVLGAGGMAVVYEVTHRNQKRFALKMLHVALSTHEDIRRRFLREGYAANTVDHPGAVAVLDDDTAEDGSAFLVMELLDGLSLDEILARHDRRLPAEAVLAVADQLLDVLAAAHPKGIVHRDIKPANLFVVRDGSIKVLDFGIARLSEASSGSQATHTGVMLGTPAFMPPEQALTQASEIDAQTDLWAVGATLFTLLSGAHVHTGQTATQILVAAATKPARAVTTVAPWLDARVAAVVDRALGFEKSARWPSAEAMREAVRAAHEEVFGGPPARASLAAFIGPGQRQPANPARFVVSGSTRAAPALTPAEGVKAKEGGSVPSSPLARTLEAPPEEPDSAARAASLASSTATPVSSVNSKSTSAPTKRSRVAGWAAICVLAAVAGAGVAALGSRGSPTPTAAPMVGATPALNARPAETATATASAPATEAASANGTASAAPSPSAAKAAPASADATPPRAVASKPSPSASTPPPTPSARRPAASDDELFHP